MKSICQSGLSLVEILVTLGIVSLLMSVAVPSFQDLIEKNKAHAFMDEFANSLYLVRGEAAKRGFQVSMCASNPAKTACDVSSDADFSSGWIIFTDYDADGVLGLPTLLFDTTGDGINDSAEGIIFVSDIAAPPAGEQNAYLFINGGAAILSRLIRYRSNGLMSGANSSGYIIVKKGSTDQLARVSISATGRVRSCFGDATACP